MTTPDFALRHYLRRAGLTRTVADALAELWRGVDPSDISRSWLERLPEAVTALTAGQLAAAQQAEAYAAASAAAEGLSGAAEGLLAAAAFAGVAADGRGLLTLLAQPVFTALSALKAGKPVAVAMDAAADQLDRIARTEVADAGRAADQVAIAARPQLEGYIRVLVGETCARCIILAGRWYPYSEGFRRHDLCDCVHLPASQARAEDLIQDPHEIYDRMTPAQRVEAGWSQEDQDAIALGADLFQVTNAKRSTYIAGSLEFTREGTTVRGLFGGYYIEPETGHLRRRATSELTKRPGQRVRSARERRLTPNQIMTSARDREHAIQLLRRYGYLLGEPTSADDPVGQEPAPLFRPLKGFEDVGLGGWVPPDAAQYHLNLDGLDGLADKIYLQGLTSAERKQFAGGAVGEVERITLDDGTVIFGKESHDLDPFDGKTMTDAEQLVSRLGQAIGAPVPRAYRNRERRLYTDWAEGRVAQEFYKNQLSGELLGPPDTPFLQGVVSSGAARRLGLLDLLVRNTDRHTYNWLVTDDGQLTGIDHGLSWGDINEVLGHHVDDPDYVIAPKRMAQIVRDELIGPFVNGWFDDELLEDKGISRPLDTDRWTPQDVIEVRRRLNLLRPEFEHLGRGDWLDYSLKVLEFLAPYAKGTRSIFDD